MLSTKKVMHYFLGFPPYRTGGLTKFAVDLMESQSEGSRVIGVWPGSMKAIGNKTQIKMNRKYKDIYSAEVVNPLPVPLDEGVSNPKAFMTKGDIEEYERILDKIKPDVIHIHTLMGLHEEFLIAAKSREIPIVFTTHDYYGICNKVYMFDGENACDVDRNCAECADCCKGGLSLNKIRLMQSKTYRFAKNSPIVKALRKRHRATYFEESQIKAVAAIEDEDIIESYKKLRDFYKRLLSYVDYFHFTSSVAERIYRAFLPNIRGKLISITHKDISDNRRRRVASDEKIRLTYLAPAKHYKGYNLMKQALDELYEEGNHNFILNIYGPVGDVSPYMRTHENGYNYEQLEEIFDNTDVLLAPSIWYETFGYTVLEAISYGVSVIISDRVGAKDIVGDGGAIIDVKKDLKSLINNLDVGILEQWNENILKGKPVKEWQQFTEEIEELYRMAKGQ